MSAARDWMQDCGTMQTIPLSIVVHGRGNFIQYINKNILSLFTIYNIFLFLGVLNSVNRDKL